MNDEDPIYGVANALGDFHRGRHESSSIWPWIDDILWGSGVRVYKVWRDESLSGPVDSGKIESR